MPNEADEIYSKCRAEQKAVHGALLQSVITITTLRFYVNDKGGSSKVFILNGIPKKVCSLEGRGCIALLMATTGIAAILLGKE